MTGHCQPRPVPPRVGIRFKFMKHYTNSIPQQSETGRTNQEEQQQKCLIGMTNKHLLASGKGLILWNITQIAFLNNRKQEEQTKRNSNRNVSLEWPTSICHENKLKKKKKIKALIALVSLSVGWENCPERGLKTLTSCNLGEQCRPWSDATFYGVWSGYALFFNFLVQVLQTKLYQQHSEVTVTRIKQL